MSLETVEFTLLNSIENSCLRQLEIVLCVVN